jgi:hypothetical protein
MHSTEPTYHTVLGNVFTKSVPAREPIAAWQSSYRTLIAAALVFGIFGLTTAAGALTQQHVRSDFDAAMRSATTISLPTLGSGEHNLF